MATTPLKRFISPQTVLNHLTEKRSKGLKVLYIGMNESALDNFYIQSLPTANCLMLKDITESSPDE
jgi:hypothetical protein